MYRNKINNKAYIGKCHVDVRKRQSKHLRGDGSQLLKQAFDKYGVDNFTFEILHDGILDIFLDDYEMEAIAKHNTIAPNGYNLTRGGEGKLGCKHSAETRKKIGDSQRGEKHWLYGKPFPEEAKRKLSAAKKGRKLTAEHRKKVSEAVKGEKNGFYGKTHTPENRKKFSIAQSKRTGKKNQFYGKTHTPENLKKLSESNKHPLWYDAHRLYTSLPIAMSLAEKRKILREKFPIVHKATIWVWVRNWSSESD